MQKFLILGFVFFQTLTFQAQDFELGKVTIEELKEKLHKTDTSAPAAIIFKKARTFFKYNNDKGFVSYTDFTIKLKIYKKEGLEWANFKIPYYVGYEKLDDESVVISKACTYNLENGQIKKDKLTKEGEFNEEVNEFWKTKTITFPNAKVGSVIEFKYVLKSENIAVLPDFQFQYEVPVDFAEYTTEIPEFYIYKGIKNGFVDVSLEEVLESTSQSTEDKYRQTMILSYKQIKSKYTAKNIPALISESYVNNVNNYYGKIEHELQTIRMPEQKPEQLATTWADVTKSIYEDKEFGKELEKVNYFINDVKSIVSALPTSYEKAIKIFDFVKNRMTWNKKYGYYTKIGVEAAYKEKSGNAAEINLMLVAMLKMAGIDANAVLISTRENGIALFPNRSRFNFVIASATIDGKRLLLDATDKLSTVNVLPIRDLNWSGRVINKDGASTEIDLMTKNASKNNINLMASISADGNVDGKLKEQYLDYNAFNFRSKSSNLDRETYLEKLEKKYDNIEVTNYEITGKSDLDKPIIETYSFKHNNSVEVIGDKMYFSPLLFFAWTQNPFKQETRKYPIDFDYPNQDKYQISIAIPEGYIVESLPAPVTVVFSDDLLTFKYNISSNGKQIQVASVFDVNTSIISADYYEELKAFYAAMIKKQTEKVVLKKG